MWAAPDHPWVDATDAAAVRVAMTVLARNPERATRVDVDAAGEIRRTLAAPRLNNDLSVGADVAGAAETPLRANVGLSSRGFTLVGRGFVLDAEEGERLRAVDPAHQGVVRPYRNGQDLARRPRGAFVIDFGLRDEAEARAVPVLYDLLRTRVFPERQANGRRSYREFWWRFGEYIVTPYVSRHRFFVVLDGAVAPDETLVAIASDDPFVLGVLSSTAHAAWAAAAGTRLGIGNDPRYNNTRCFDAFPFPDAPAPLRAGIAAAATTLDAHRRAALTRGTQVTMTAMYNVLGKVRAGQPLTVADQTVHTLAACGTLQDLHDRLDVLVAEAYGWAWPEPSALVLERLVALHDARLEEERRGIVHWLRATYQAPRFTGQNQTRFDGLEQTTVVEEPTARPAWPATVIEQIAALQAVAAAAPVSVEEAAARFAGARRESVARHLDTLAIMGELQEMPDGRYGVLLAAA